MKFSDSIAKLAPALVAVQGELKGIGKDATNPAFKSKYATLDHIIDAVRPILAKHSLALVQGATTPITDADGTLAGFAVETMLLHASGEYMMNAAVMPIVKRDPQGAGGALTYGRRYGLSALLSISTDEDDDGNAASRPNASAAASRSNTSAAPLTSNQSAVVDKLRAEVSAAERRPAPIEERAPLDDAEVPCPKCGGKTWDNRVGKKNPKSPDYKCRDKACDGVIWPPRDTKPKSAPKVSAPDDADYLASVLADNDDDLGF